VRRSRQLAQVRLRLTLLYAGVFTLILAVLGGGLFVAIRRQMTQQLDVSLHAATGALMQAARIREAEQANAHGAVVDAIDELHIPDRSLYLLDGDGSPIKPATAPVWVSDAARAAVHDGRADRDFEIAGNRVVRVHAERFTGATGGVLVAAVAADRVELEDQFASLIRAFAAAALAALLLVGGGGYLLVRQSTAPIEGSLDQMRRFMADAAHELRTPITTLRTRAEVAVAADRDPTRDATTLEAVAREAARLGDIAGDLLTLARADAGERPVARESLFLDDAVAGAVDTVRALADSKGVRLDVARFEEAPIVGDPALIRQLLLIVLDNAIKFTAAGGSVRLETATQHGRAEVVVQDSGIGIPADQLRHVFERFYRGDAARREAEGAGLGLAIARWIADAHGARIELQSEPGNGTRVRVSFPVVGV
jgi:signal transduction histidine kinase